MADGNRTCPKCGGYLYNGWHTNVPGKTIGREADETICLMTGALREEVDRERKARDKVNSTLAAMVMAAKWNVARADKAEAACAAILQRWRDWVHADIPERKVAMENLATAILAGPDAGQSLLDKLGRLREENQRLNIALFAVENGLAHPDPAVRKLIEAAKLAAETQT